MPNLLEDVPATLFEELVEVLAAGEAVRIERIVSRGHCTPADDWYDQAQAEWVAVLSGRASLLFEHDPEPVQLQPGDYLLIPPHRKHRVVWTSPDEPTVWLAVFFDT